MTEEESSSSSPPAPRNRLKFLFSHGGKILPRPSDGQLKYVGGDTRVVSAPRPLSFSELKEKVGAVFPGEVVVRYQLLGDDLDALVTVKSDDDVHHMLDEYDRQEAARSNSYSPTFAGGCAGTTASPRFRLFLFPVDPAPVDSPPHRQRLLRCGSVEQRYIEAINGGGGGCAPRRLSGAGGGGTGGKSIFTISSGGSSPTSTAPTAYPAAPMPVLSSLDFVGGGLRRSKPMHKAHSSPNLMEMAAEPHSRHLHHYPQQTHQYHYQQTFYKQPTHNRSSHHLSSFHSSQYQPHYPHLHTSQAHNLPHHHAHQSHHGGGGRTSAIPPVATEPLWRMSSGPPVNSGTGSGGGIGPGSRPGSPALSPQPLLSLRQHYGAGPFSYAGGGFGSGPGPLRGGPPPCPCGGHVDDVAHSSRPRSLEGYYTWEQ